MDSKFTQSNFISVNGNWHLPYKYRKEKSKIISSWIIKLTDWLMTWFEVGNKSSTNAILKCTTTDITAFFITFTTCRYLYNEWPNNSGGPILGFCKSCTGIVCRPGISWNIWKQRDSLLVLFQVERVICIHVNIFHRILLNLLS